MVAKRIPRNRGRVVSLLDELYKYDYTEKPVSVDTFLDDPTFLGKMTKDKTTGLSTVYPVWREELNKMMRMDEKYQCVLTGSIGCGKTRVAVWGALFCLYRILLLRDPWGYFGKASGDKMAVAFFNLTKSLGSSNAYQLLQNYLVNSSWFCDRGRIKGTEDNPRVEFNLFEYLLASPYSKGFGIQGRSIIIGIMDEVDSPNESEGQKLRVLSAYNNAIGRFESRFVHETDKATIGKFFLVSSKQEKLSFLNTFIAKMKNSNNVYVVDIPQWKATSRKLSGKTFKVALGTTYIEPKIVKNNEELKECIKESREIIEVPVEYYAAFSRDVVGSLRDIAGVATSYLRKYKLFYSEQLVDNCFDPDIPIPVKKQTIVAGLHDEINLANYIDFSKIQNDRNLPRFFHQDISFSKDCMGAAMSCICGWKTVNREDLDGSFKSYKLPVVQTELILRLKAKEGDRFPLKSVVRLVLDLRDVYKFNIRRFTADLILASEHTKQTLEQRGIECDYFSLDRNPQWYRSFRDVVEEERWVCYKHPILRFELVNLEDDPEKNKVDHPKEVAVVQYLENGDSNEVVLLGSKDLSDAAAGSAIGALQNTEQPPDTEYMSGLMEKILEKSAQETDDLWWVDSGINKKKKEEINISNDGGMSKSERKNFENIFRKATR